MKCLFLVSWWIAVICPTDSGVFLKNGQILTTIRPSPGLTAFLCGFSLGFLLGDGFFQSSDFFFGSLSFGAFLFSADVILCAIAITFTAGRHCLEAIGLLFGGLVTRAKARHNKGYQQERTGEIQHDVFL